MVSELEELLERQAQLKAMKQSCAEFEKKLNEDIGEYVDKTLGLKGEVTLLDIIAKAKEK